MTTETLPAVVEIDHARKAALLKAIGLDKVPPEQRELALNIAKRYDLDLMLKHLVLIDGRPYITRDGLLWVAHRSGQLDGIEVSDPEVVDIEGVGKFWRASCSVYRKDMSRPITYAGRYPTNSGNVKYAPEMAVKVAEVMALRRAFNVSAPVVEERWELPTSQPAEPKPDLSVQVAARRQAITDAGARGESVGIPEPAPAGAYTVTQDPTPGSTDAGIPMPAPASGSGVPPLASEPDVQPVECGAMPPEDDPLGLTAGGPCQLRGSHRVHRNTEGTWPKAARK